MSRQSDTRVTWWQPTAMEVDPVAAALGSYGGVRPKYPHKTRGGSGVVARAVKQAKKQAKRGRA